MPCSAPLINGGDLVEEDAHRPAIDDDVVDNQNQQMFFRTKSEQQQTQQRGTAEIEDLAPLFRRQLQGLGPACRGGQMRQVARREINRHILADFLEDLAVLLDEGCAQRLVAAQKRREAVAERLDIELANC
jgi:hypothetical protein